MNHYKFQLQPVNSSGATLAQLFASRTMGRTCPAPTPLRAAFTIGTHAIASGSVTACTTSATSATSAAGLPRTNVGVEASIQRSAFEYTVRIGNATATVLALTATGASFPVTLECG
mmetsp:Transcript_8669/g.18694  ORF Transcript_8669/g.18694 Transcript_8669/m.18694 type:complete len:116 (+) Transcript_8669:142-489(+)